MSLGSGVTLRLGDYVKQASKPAWGIGKIISISERQNATIFFLGGGTRIVQATSAELEKVDCGHPILELAGTVNWNFAVRNLYVIELNPKIFDWERRCLRKSKFEPVLTAKERSHDCCFKSTSSG